MSLSFGYPCSRSPLSVSASSLVVAVTFAVVGRYLPLLPILLFVVPSTSPALPLPVLDRAYAYVTMPPSLLLPASVSVSVLCYFFPASSFQLLLYSGTTFQHH